MEPNHHRAYRVAWESYRDPDTPKECLNDLGKAMDNAQNSFTWDEFQAFKATLPGYNEFWDMAKNKMMKYVKEEFRLAQDGNGND